MARRASRPRRWPVGRAAWGLVAAAPLLTVGGGPPTLAAQEAGARLRAAVRLSADTVRVGEPFTVGVVVAGADSVRFPPLLDVAEAWEQLEIARVEAGDPGELRAYYRLVAWTAGRLELPGLVVSTAGASPREFLVDLPAPFVASVLPADADAGDLELRGPRPPFGAGFPWWWLLLLALLAALALWWWRRRRRAAGEEQVASQTSVEVTAAERARAALVALRERAEAGELGAAVFYDRLEEILREYLSGTREWPPTLPVRASTWTARGAMRELHRRAVMSRFGGVGAPGPHLLADVDASLDWLTKDAA